MSTQLIVLGTRRQDSDEDYKAYVSVAGPLLFGAGGTISAQYDQTAHIAGDGGPQQVLVMDFPDEQTIQGVFQSQEYAKVVPNRDAAFENISVIVTSSEN